MGFPTTDTFGTMIDEAVTRLHAWGASSDQIVTLQSSIDSDDVELQVSDSTVLSRGVVEIDTELIYVDSASGGVATVPAWGRGFRSSTAASHTAGAAVTIQPTYPRAVVARELNNSLRAVYPTLFGVGEELFTSDSTYYQYEMPAAAQTVLAVQWRRDTTTGWIPVEGWALRTITATADFASGKFIVLLDAIPSGATVKVTYAKRPTDFASESDAFTATGLVASAKDVVMLGALAVLAGSLDLARVTVQTAEAQAMAGTRPVGIATQIANDLRKQYAQRLADERRALLAVYPIRAHKTW